MEAKYSQKAYTKMLELKAQGRIKVFKNRQGLDLAVLDENKELTGEVYTLNQADASELVKQMQKVG